MSQKSDNSDYKENTLNPILCLIGLAAVAGLAGELVLIISTIVYML